MGKTRIEVPIARFEEDQDRKLAYAEIDALAKSGAFRGEAKIVLSLTVRHDRQRAAPAPSKPTLVEE